MRINALGNTATDFASDDYIAIDGTTNGSRKMKNDSLLNVTAHNALAGNVAPAFDPTKPNDAGGYAYYKDEIVINNGETYRFKTNHSSGAWNSSEVDKIELVKLVDDNKNSVFAVSSKVKVKMVGKNDVSVITDKIAVLPETNLTFAVDNNNWAVTSLPSSDYNKLIVRYYDIDGTSHTLRQYSRDTSVPSSFTLSIPDTAVSFDIFFRADAGEIVNFTLSPNLVSNINSKIDSKLAWSYSGVIGNLFSSSSTYEIGELVVNGNNAYIFKSAKSSGSWDASKVAVYRALINRVVNVVSFGKVPKFDPTALTLTIYAGTRISVNGRTLDALTEDVVVPWTYSSYTYCNIIFNVHTHAFSLSPYVLEIAGNSVCVGGIYRMKFNENSWMVGGLVWGENSVTEVVAKANSVSNVIQDLTDTWKSKISYIKGLQGKCITFCVQTDVHFNPAPWGENNRVDPVSKGWNFGILPKYLGLDFMTLPGDIIQGYGFRDTTQAQEDYTEFMKRVVGFGFCPVLTAVGNHDNNRTNDHPEYGISNDAVYANIISSTRDTRKGAVEDGRTPYYYYDVNNYLRCIVLNTGDSTYYSGFAIGEDQLQWVEDVALNTNKKVIVISHVPLVDKIDGENDHNNNASIRQVLPLLKNFVDNGGTIICCISGHTHKRLSRQYEGIWHINCIEGALTDRAEIFLVDEEDRTIRGIMIGSNDADRTFVY